MMKQPKNYRSFLIVLWLILITIRLAGQDPQDILRNAYTKAQSIQEGYYEMTTGVRTSDRQDMFLNHQKCWFKKSPKDKIFGFRFHTIAWSTNQIDDHTLYTGDGVFATSPKDSTGTYTSVARWKKQLKSDVDLYAFYDIFTNIKYSGLPHPRELNSKDTEVSYVRMDTLLNQSCHVIQVQYAAEAAKGEPFQVLRLAYQFWISATTSMVLQYNSFFDMAINADTMHQYEVRTLDTFFINTPIDEIALSSASLPSFYAFTDFTPHQRPTLLQPGVTAPPWTLPALNSIEISLADYKGKLVLLDFFFKSCIPCIQAFPGLQHLYDTYSDHGLVVIGMNPFDTAEDDLPSFMQKHHVTYPVVYATREIANLYYVSGYPTLYLIDRDGKIVHSQSGFGEGTEDNLETIIQKNLED